uniref:IFT140 second beta-propeller domain-containing protein n=1 Tax=Anopheles coluzzii TaxID=1518534 RepID=A0A8W7PB55_ANOCL
LNELHLVVTNGRTVAVYRIDPAGTMRGTRAGPDAGAEPDALAVSHVDSFAVECGAVYLYEQSIVALGTEQVKIYSLSGIILQELVFNANEGECINSSFDCYFSSGLRVRVSVVVR